MGFFSKKKNETTPQDKEKKPSESKSGGFFNKLKKGMKTVGDKSKELYEKGKDKVSKKKEQKLNTDYPEEEQPDMTPQPSLNPGYNGSTGINPNMNNMNGNAQQQYQQVQGPFPQQPQMGNPNFNPQEQQNDKPKGPSTGDKVLQGTKSFLKGTGKLMGNMFNKMKKEMEESSKKERFYEYRKQYWAQFGFMNGPPPGRENEFSFGSPAYIDFCQKNNYKIEYPAQNHQPQMGNQPQPGPQTNQNYNQRPQQNYNQYNQQQQMGNPMVNQYNQQQQHQNLTPVQKMFVKDEKDLALEQFEQMNNSAGGNKEVNQAIQGLKTMNQMDKGIKAINHTFGTNLSLMKIMGSTVKAGMKANNAMNNSQNNKQY